MYVQLFGLEIWEFVTREKKTNITYCLFCTNHNMSYLETQKIVSMVQRTNLTYDFLSFMNFLCAIVSLNKLGGVQIQKNRRI